MSKQIYITFLLLIIPSLLLAQNFKRGFKLLEKNDYEKAYEVFIKVLEEEPENVSSHFGLALIYSNEDFSNTDFTTAWEYADFAKKNKDKLTTEELEILTEFYINTEERRSSRPVKKKIDNSIELVLDKLIRYIRESNDVELVKNVLEKFPAFVYYQNTVHIRNYLEYRAFEKLNTIEGYNQFISGFPDAAQVPLAIEKRNSLIFNNTKKKNSLVSYNEFIHKYPNSKYISEAIRLRNKIAFDEAKQNNTVESIESFIVDYPDALEVLDAKKIQKQLIYERAKKIRSLEAYDDFIRKYPDGVQYVDIFNLKSKDLGEKLLQRSKYPIQSFQWARVFDNDNKYDEASDIIYNDNSEEIFLACNTFEDSTEMMNAWIICLDNNGEMIWNKQIGEVFNDKVDKAKLSGSTIYFAGQTKGLNDSITGEPWLFTIKTDGTKVWNRTYSIPSIDAFDITANDELLLGSYHGDTIQQHYLTKLSNRLKRLWKREYTNIGIVSSISILNNNDLIVGGNNWLYKLDTDGYLKWEKYLQEGDSIIACSASNDFISITGMRDSLTVFISQYDQNSKLLWDKSFLFEDGIEIASIKTDIEGNTYFAGTSDTDGVLIKLDGSGAVLDNLMFGTEKRISFTSLFISSNNQVYVGANESDNAGKSKGGSDVILLKYLP